MVSSLAISMLPYSFHGFWIRENFHSLGDGLHPFYRDKHRHRLPLLCYCYRMLFGNFNYFREVLLRAFYCIRISHTLKVYTFSIESKPFGFKYYNHSFIHPDSQGNRISPTSTDGQAANI